MTESRLNANVATDGLNAAIDNGIGWLLRAQTSDGFWVGMLESNSCMEAQWVLMQHILGVTDDPKYEGVVRCIMNEQSADGSWAIYYGAGGDINTTVECYAALRAAGRDPQSPPLRKAREWIFRNGGLGIVRNFTRYWLALIGEWPWACVPVLPPELIVLPRWMPFNIYQFSSWSRGTIVPLCVLSARQPVHPLPAVARLDELFPQGREAFDFTLRRKHGWCSWEGLFFCADRLLRRYRTFPLRPFRETAIKLCLEWILKHQEADGAWSGIQPPWVYSLMALYGEGYALSHPVLAGGLDAFNKHWKVERNGGTYLQASESPVWDTVLSLSAIQDCGRPPETLEAMTAAVDWVLGEQVTTWGDWQVYAPEVPPGGWAFEFENDAYPDVDDTAVALLVLQRLAGKQRDSDPRLAPAIRKGTAWMLGMQCRNGGWAAFDRDNDYRLLTKIPFADFGELLDPPSVDVTGHVLEALAAQGRVRGDAVVDRAVAYLRSEQERDGSWFGRWGCNHIYGTAAVLPALHAVGEDMSQSYVRRAVAWIIAHQNEDGGWGETCASYMDVSARGVGKSTASQTAWALIGLLAVGDSDVSTAVHNGVAYLIRHQCDQGTWDEPEYTGTGFPGYGVGERIKLDGRTTAEMAQTTNLERAFMINYNMYRHYFPLMALGRARRYFTGSAPERSH